MSETTMTTIRNVLIVLVLVELFGTGAFIVLNSWSPHVPEPDLARLPLSTKSALHRLQHAARKAEPHAWRDLGEAYLAYGYFAEAEFCLRRAVRETPDDFAAVFGRAYSLDRMGRTRDAQPYFEAAARLADPDMFRRCFYQLGRNHLRNEDAIAAKNAFAIIDKFPPADYQRARLFLMEEKYAEVDRFIARLLTAYPNDLTVHRLSMRLDQAQHRSNTVVQHMDHVERGSPDLRLTDDWLYLHPIRSRYGLHAGLAAVESFHAAGKLTDAAKAFEAIVQQTDPEFLLDKLAVGAELELRAGRPRDALRLLHLLQDRRTLPPTALHLLGDAWHDLGENDKAIQAWQRANAQHPRATSHAMLASLLEGQGDWENAKRQRGLSQLAAGVEAFRQNQVKLAQQRLEEAAQAVPDEPWLWFHLGEARRVLLQTDSAIEAYRRCIAIKPNHGRALSRLASLDREQATNRQ